MFTRVFPILDWCYSDVWAFLKHYDLTYCVLYDHGYTSLGEIHNSQKNPHLKMESDAEAFEDEDNYKPAYCLEHGDYERYSRRDPS